jgi:hypothetical protein
MAKKAIPLERVREAAMARRSELYSWMMQNHEQFAAVVAEAVRPNWRAIAEAFASEGLTDADGKPPSAEATRQTWWKVRKAVKARTASRAGKMRPETRLPAKGPASEQVTRLHRLFDDKPAQQGERPAPAVRAKSPPVSPQSDDDDDFIKPMGGPKVWKKD